MNNTDKLREYIRELINKYLEEMTTTGNVAGYLTPKAFRGNGKDGIDHVKKLANKTGYTLTPRGEKDANRPADRLEIIKKTLNEIKYSSITAHAFRGNKPENSNKIIQLSTLHDHTLTQRGERDHMRPADHHEDAMRSKQELEKLSTRGEYTPLPSEDTEATKVTPHVIKKTVVTPEPLAETNYYQYKNDATSSPHKKIATAISKLNKNLDEIDRVLKYNSRLKIESGITNEELYKRTQKGLLKLETKLLRLAGRLRDIRGQ